MRHDVGEGMRWLWQHADVRDVTIFAGVLSVMDAAWFAVLILYVVQILHQRPGAYGLLLAVAALGGIITGAAGASLTRRLGPWRSLVPGGLVMAVTQAAVGLSGNVVVSAAMLFASSAAWALFNMTAVTMLQRQVPDGLLGRVTSLFGTVTRGAEALGAIAGGVLAAAAGIRAPCWPVPSRSPLSQQHSGGGIAAAINFLMPSPGQAPDHPARITAHCPDAHGSAGTPDLHRQQAGRSL